MEARRRYLERREVELTSRGIATDYVHECQDYDAKEVCAPVHDAFLIESPLDRLDEDVARMQELMSAAGRAVTGGINIRTEAEIVRWPNRYMDERGKAMWDRVVALLDRRDRTAA